MAVIVVKGKEELNTHKKSGSLVVVDFYAVWCGPCKMIAPKLEELSTKYTNVTFLKVDVDELQELATEYSITAMPTFILFKNESQLEVIVGSNVAKLEEAIKKHA
ncbi:Thioredoxin-2 [Coelomomyces lativittatus]|nr:Thioredoxin-2 [Coelomomyces lativittatus]KAJ1503552.1 Thioredoxin-2 [Coelomomyces lativittatus]KAJ1507021.1 Thioredoxin-2 [Coelomomyces lativittatus]